MLKSVLYRVTHDVTSYCRAGKKAKEDNVNTPIIAMFLYGGKADIATNMSEPLTYNLPYLDVSHNLYTVYVSTYKI